MRILSWEANFNRIHRKHYFPCYFCPFSFCDELCLYFKSGSNISCFVNEAKVVVKRIFYDFSLIKLPSLLLEIPTKH